MHFKLLQCLASILIFTTLALTTPIDDSQAQAQAEPRADPLHLIQNLYPRQVAPTSYTTSRSGNTDFAPPQTLSPSSTESPTTPITSRVSNNQIVASSDTSAAPPLVTTDSRSANTQAVGPSTVSSGLAAPTGRVRFEAVLGVVVVGVVGVV